MRSRARAAKQEFYVCESLMRAVAWKGFVLRAFRSHSLGRVGRPWIRIERALLAVDQTSLFFFFEISLRGRPCPSFSLEFSRPVPGRYFRYSTSRLIGVR